jgi:hypothetical protein
VPVGQPVFSFQPSFQPCSNCMYVKQRLSLLQIRPIGGPRYAAEQDMLTAATIQYVDRSI